MSYDASNVFAKILRGDIPCEKLYEDEMALAFPDMHPQAPVHVLVIPKGPYTSYTDFMRSASAEEIVGFGKAVGNVTQKLELTNSGYRLISNTGPDSGQEVQHYHVHILGGEKLGPLTGKK